jgi:predicted amidohydrolase
MSEQTLRIALIQFDRSHTSIAKSQAHAIQALDRIEEVDIVCFPEVWMGAVILGRDENRVMLEEFSTIAKQKQFTILTGGLLEEDRDSVFDTCHIIDRDKGIIGEQQKIFPSGAVGERYLLKGGEGLAVFTCAGVRCGVLICVDLFYPELMRELALADVKVIFNPANIPEQRNDLWHRLVRTRSAENTVFTAYVNNTNTHYMDGRPVKGRSLISGPSGEIIASGSEAPTTLHANLEIALLSRQRQRWPYVEDMRKIVRSKRSPYSVRVLE